MAVLRGYYGSGSTEGTAGYCPSTIGLQSGAGGRDYAPIHWSHHRNRLAQRLLPLGRLVRLPVRSIACLCDLLAPVQRAALAGVRVQLETEVGTAL